MMLTFYFGCLCYMTIALGVITIYVPVIDTSFIKKKNKFLLFFLSYYNTFLDRRQYEIKHTDILNVIVYTSNQHIAEGWGRY